MYVCVHAQCVYLVNAKTYVVLLEFILCCLLRVFLGVLSTLPLVYFCVYMTFLCSVAHLFCFSFLSWTSPAENLQLWRIVLCTRDADL